MADNNATELARLSDKLFAKKATLDILHQTLAEQFYPERADFTAERIDGAEFAEVLIESVPAQNRRDLASAMGAMLRPRGQRWFQPKPKSDSVNTDKAKKWFFMAGDVMRDHLYRHQAKFRMAWQQGDDDFVSFGNAVSALTESGDRQGLYFETFHPRDCCWSENRYRDVDVVHRKFVKDLRGIKARWGERGLSEKAKTAIEKDPYQEETLRVTCMPVADYEPYNVRLKKSGRFKYICVYYDPEQARVLEEVGYNEFPYMIRRWRLNTNSQYAYSPASMLGLCDARLLQSQAQVILEAGEKVVDPPLLVTQEGVIGDVNVFSGAITYLDAKYDERQGAAVRPLETRANLPIGLEMKQDTREVLNHAWLLNKLQLPGEDREMTATETRERVSEYIRSATPIFEPFEADNAAMLDLEFRVLMRITMEVSRGGIEQGPFAPLSQIPPEIQGTEIDFEMDTPIQLAYRRQTALHAQEIVSAVVPMAQINPEVGDNFDVDSMARDVNDALGGRPNWLKPLEAIAQVRDQRRQQQEEAAQAQKAAMMAKSGADIAKAAPSAVDALKQFQANTQTGAMGGLGDQGGEPGAPVL